MPQRPRACAPRPQGALWRFACLQPRSERSACANAESDLAFRGQPLHVSLGEILARSRPDQVEIAASLVEISARYARTGISMPRSWRDPAEIRSRSRAQASACAAARTRDRVSPHAASHAQGWPPAARAGARPAARLLPLSVKSPPVWAVASGALKRPRRRCSEVARAGARAPGRAPRRRGHPPRGWGRWQWRGGGRARRRGLRRRRSRRRSRRHPRSTRPPP
mmetsp:Transcript_51791/g.119036  ORF Transcript_51791/g.119036 Transcript_51791/m.119036 type:complete len:223 (-) Transcript_51791:342-1010(-)